MTFRIPKTLSASLLAALASLVHATPEVYVFDPQHTYPNFEIGHAGFSVSRGWFEKTTGRVTLDRANGTGDMLVEIDAASVNTGLAVRDSFVRSDKFGLLDVTKYPTITFRASRFTFNGPQLERVGGELTIKGTTKPVELQVVNMRCGEHPVSKRAMCGGEANTLINKSDFGEFGGRMLGEQIRIALQFEAYKE